MVLLELILNHVFTLELWIRPYVDEMENANLYTISPDFADFTLTNGDTPTMVFDSQSYNVSTVLSRRWQNLAYVIDNTELSIYIDGLLMGQDTLTGLFIDKIENTHILGIGYIGFIAEVCIHQKVLVDFNLTEDHDCTEAFDCEICPKQQCLSNCEYDEYVDIETRECGKCEPDCVTGCMRPTDCTNCVDELCETCSLYEI